MQIRLTVLGPRSGHTTRACDVLVTAPAGTPLASVAGSLAASVAGSGADVGGGGSGSAGGSGGTGSSPVVLYAGAERLDLQRAAIGEPPLIDGAVLSLQGPGPAPAHGLPHGQARLRVVSGPDAGGVHLLHGGQIRIGRSADADVPLDDPDVSRLHCAVTVEPDGSVYVADLRSTNGTAVDGTDLGEQPAPLRPGTLLRIGESALRLQASPGAPDPALAATPDGEGHLRITPQAAGAESQARHGDPGGAPVPAGPQGSRADGGSGASVRWPEPGGTGAYGPGGPAQGRTRSQDSGTRHPGADPRATPATSPGRNPGRARTTRSARSRAARRRPGTGTFPSPARASPSPAGPVRQDTPLRGTTAWDDARGRPPPPAPAPARTSWTARPPAVPPGAPRKAPGSPRGPARPLAGTPRPGTTTAGTTTRATTTSVPATRPTTGRCPAAPAPRCAPGVRRQPRGGRRTRHPRHAPARHPRRRPRPRDPGARRGPARGRAGADARRAAGPGPGRGPEGCATRRDRCLGAAAGRRQVRGGPPRGAPERTVDAAAEHTASPPAPPPTAPRRRGPPPTSDGPTPPRSC